MKILDRYFLREFVKPLGACLVAFLLCMGVHDLFDNMNDFIQAKTPLREVGRYYFILLPAWLVDMMPVSLLLSLLYVLATLSKHGELTAMRSCALDFHRLMRPYFILGGCVSVIMTGVHLLWSPTALSRAKQVFDEATSKKSTLDSAAIVKGVAYRDLEGNRYWTIDSLDLQLERAFGVEMLQSDDQGRDLRKISAESASYENGHWTFYRVYIYDYRLPLVDPRVLHQEPILTTPDITEAPSKFIVHAKKAKRMPTGELWNFLRFSERLSPKQKAFYATEFHYRLSFSTANLIVFLIGIPFGVVGQRKSPLMAVVNSLLFFGAFLVMTFLTSTLAKAGRLSPVFAAWLPHLCFGTAGLFLIRRIR